MSATAIQFASENAAHHGLTSLRFTQRNILAEPLDHGAYDIVMCTLFLHHLDEDDAVKVLQTMQNGACRMVVVDDLLRTQFGYWLAWLGTRLLTRCHVVHVDGPMSVEGAFTWNEAKNLARKAGLSNVRLSTHWPQRFLLTAAVQNEASRDES